MLKRVIPILLAILLLVYALKDVSFSEIAVQFRKANYGWIGLAGLLSLLTFYLRGKRWQQPLLALGHTPTAFRTTVAFQAGMMASMIVLGSGELTRCATLQRTDNVPFSHSIGSIVAERVLDMIMLLIVLLLVFLIEITRMKTYFAGLSFVTPNALLLGLLVAGLVGGGALYWLWHNPSMRSHPLTAKIIGFSRGLWEGFSAIRQLPNPGLFIALTILIQVAGWAGTYVMLLSSDATSSLSPTAALTILAVSSLGGLAVPTQGGIGTYHFLVSRVLVLYGLSLEQGVVAATFMHAVGFGIGLLISSVSFLIIPFLVSKSKKTTESVREV